MLDRPRLGGKVFFRSHAVEAFEAFLPPSIHVLGILFSSRVDQAGGLKRPLEK